MVIIYALKFNDRTINMFNWTMESHRCLHPQKDVQ